MAMHKILKYMVFILHRSSEKIMVKLMNKEIYFEFVSSQRCLDTLTRMCGPDLKCYL